MYTSVIQVGMLGTNCYILADEETKLAAVIDPGGEAGRIHARLKKEGFTLKYILLTHGHRDHTDGVEALRRETGAEVMIHRDELSAPGKPASLFYQPEGPVTYIDEGDHISLGGLDISVMKTPGHTVGSLVFKVGDVLFCGDTLFAGSCGRCDLPGGDEAAMLRSLKRLYDIPGDYKVYPGHEALSTLARERKGNFFMKGFSGGNGDI